MSYGCSPDASIDHFINSISAVARLYLALDDDVAEVLGEEVSRECLGSV